MQHINLKMDGDSAWPEVEGKAIDLPNENLDVVFLDNGTNGGQPIVAIKSQLEDTHYIIQLTGRQFQTLAAAFKGKYGVIE